MADEIDRANDYAQTGLDAAIASARVGVELAATGECLWCEKPVPDKVRFCCADCRDDWQKRNPGL